MGAVVQLHLRGLLGLDGGMCVLHFLFQSSFIAFIQPKYDYN